jgi:hypothetical protein
MGYQIISKRKYSRQVYLFDWRIRIPFRVPDGGVEVGAFFLGPEILILPKGFPEAFLAFF